MNLNMELLNIPVREQIGPARWHADHRRQSHILGDSLWRMIDAFAIFNYDNKL